MTDLTQVKEEYERLCAAGKRREAAEYAFALAKLHQKAGDSTEATRYGQLSIDHFDACTMETQAQCAGLHQEIGGVLIPGLIHQDVVKRELGL
jgi:hypothetical protein